LAIHSCDRPQQRPGAGGPDIASTLRRLEAALTIKTVLIAVAAAAALIGAALMAVPSAQEGLHLCLDLPRCLGF
jgi:hypothetical protein